MTDHIYPTYFKTKDDHMHNNNNTGSEQEIQNPILKKNPKHNPIHNNFFLIKMNID